MWDFYMKALNNVWHDGIIFKLRKNDISGAHLNLSCDYLRNRKHRVVLNEQVSTWTNLTQEPHKVQ